MRARSRAIPCKRDLNLPTFADANEGVGPQRVAQLRRLYLDGFLLAYCTALLDQTGAG